MKELQSETRSLNEIYAKNARCQAWMNDPVRCHAIQACAMAAGSTDEDFPPLLRRGLGAIDFACAGQILFGEYDNSKVAQPEFVEAVLRAARKYPELTDAPGLRRA